MSDQTKFYQLCRATGVWREMPHDPAEGHPADLLDADYEHRFFLMDCFAAERAQVAEGADEEEQASAENHSVVYLRSDDPDLPELDPELKWDIKKSPTWQEPAEPERRQMEVEIRDRLHGIWETGRIGSMEDQFVVFQPNGSGIIEYWQPSLQMIDEFRWQLIAGERLLIEPTGVSEKHERRHGPFQYFGAAQLHTVIQQVTNSRGETFDLLQISPLANPGRRLELRRSTRLLSQYQVPDLEEGES